MGRKKIILILLAGILIGIIIHGAVMSDSSKVTALEEPVFERTLQVSGDMDFETKYICNRDDDRSVVSIIIPDTEDNVHCSIYDESGGMGLPDGYGFGTVEWGIAFDNINEDGGIDEDFTFNEIIVKWSDGTEQTVDIGDITIVAKEPEILDSTIFINGRESSSISGTHKVSGTATLNDTETVKKIAACMDDILLNDVDLRELIDGGTYEIAEGGETLVDISIPDEGLNGYDEMNCLIPVNVDNGETIVNGGLHILYACTEDELIKKLSNKED